MKICSVIVMQALIFFFSLSLKKVQGELPFDPEVSQLFADICFIVEGHEFMCHKVKC